MGVFEIALGTGLLIGRKLPIFIGAATLHLLGTFLVLLLRPDVAFVDGNPLLLTVEGAYVVQNRVLLAATASLSLHSLGDRPAGTKSFHLADAQGSGHPTPTEGAA